MASKEKNQGGTPPWVGEEKESAPAAVNSVAEDVSEAEKLAVSAETKDTVTVTVPKAFQLRWDNDLLLKFNAGVQEMEQRYAEHWYAKANGVTIYKPKSPKAKEE